MSNNVCTPRPRPLLDPPSVGQAWSTLSIFLILMRASTVYQWRIQGTFAGGPDPHQT